MAGKLGAAVALSRICSGTVPTTAVVKVLEASGLSQQDVLGETPIRERMQNQASAVMIATELQKESGELRRDRAIGMRKLSRQFRPERAVAARRCGLSRERQPQDHMEPCMSQLTKPPFSMVGIDHVVFLVDDLAARRRAGMPRFWAASPAIPTRSSEWSSSGAAPR